MINLEYIKQFYNNLLEKRQTQNIIKEYLQYNILSIIYDSKYWKKLSFLWWTSIRIIYNANRFSENLDFDNFWLNEEDFEKLTKEIEKWLKLLWFKVEIRNIYKGAWHCNIKLPEILFENWLSNYKDEKILIQIDTVKQDYIYKPDKKIIDKFDIYSYINTTPINILLSKKIHALFARKRLKWRDFYDIVYLTQFTKPNYDYLNTKIWIKNDLELKNKLLNFCKDLDLEKISLDVKPFLINKDEVLRIVMFRKFIKENF
jgi:hypothetical protein